MSEQGKSNFQAFGAGLLGFVAVVAVGGAAMLLHSSRQATAPATPAAAPIDLAAPAARPMTSSAPIPRERRAESPAPLIGVQDEEYSGAAPAVPEAAAAGRPGARRADAVSPVILAAKEEPALETTEHLAQTGSSSAEQRVKNRLAPEKAAKPAPKRAAAAKADAPAAGSSALASVHYGVTSRSELMGRAAGPVYNFSGGAKGADSAARGKMGGVDGKIADIQRQLEISGLPDDQRAKLKQDLEAALQSVPAEKATAQ